ncbi:splicing factor U2AF large subunit [Skeletonema marinoi]|uniref:Splicing factor U2AF large subunit n=1 Tax=Skeletonema marinoi TaxID=267567 RepID=A0AAD9DF33_9STRA|nr:splicing factor U2AF large subunit [Skeletonema marinoi]
MSGAAAPRGRGAGINKPAWLVAQEREAALGSAPLSGDVGTVAPAVTSSSSDGVVKKEEGDNNNEPVERDQFGRVGRGGGSSSNNGAREYDDRPRGGSRSNDRRGGSHDRRYNNHNNDRHRGGGGGRRGDRHYRSGGGGGRSDRGGGRGGGGTTNRSGIHFHSYEEERAWLEERRRKRRSRKSLFDVEPSPEQLAEEEARATMERDHIMMTGAGGMGIGATSAGGGGGMRSEGSRGGGLQPQQTRHARRLYIGNIPDIHENDVHNFFRDAIRSAIIMDLSNPNPSHQKQYIENDPIISVYINRERRFAFLEFKTMEITTSCLDLDGINVMGHGKVTIKRPNDYNPAWAPPVNPSTLPRLDTAKLGIVSSTVPDGPNKIFIGGLPYHLTESQVLELLGAFGTVKAFHLVKADATALTSKGYCFVEYADPNLTQVACMGLNGMDMGGGKQLSCRMAVQGHSTDNSGLAAVQTGGGAFAAPVAAPPAAATVVDGVDVDALLNAALGGGAAAAPIMTAAIPAAAPMMQMNPMQPQQAAVDPMAVANMLDAALGGASAGVGGPMGGLPPQPVSATPQATRVLVLLNMVLDEDLTNDEDFGMLEEEVREEVGKYGKLLSMKIPRPQDGCAPSAVKKIFLEYATPSDAMNAEKELKGRAFGPNVVDASYFSEESYARNALS